MEKDTRETQKKSEAFKKKIKAFLEKLKKKIKAKSTKDFSPEHKKFIRGIRLKKTQIIILQIGLLVAFFGLWELSVRAGWIDPLFISSPSRMLNTLKLMLDQEILFKHIGVTLGECILGFAISTLTGWLIAVLLWWWETCRRVLEPYIVVLNSLPKIAMGPLIIIWVGVGAQSIIVMIVLICIIITIMSMLNSFIGCSQEKTVLLRTMGAKKWQILTKLVIPHSVPAFMSVLKINVGLAWVGTIMGEYLSSSAGLGNQIIFGQLLQNYDLVMTCIVILCVLAALMYFVVAIAEKIVNKLRA